jgi:hypothetical protein
MIGIARALHEARRWTRSMPPLIGTLRAPFLALALMGFCPHGQILRVHLHRCVGEHSQLARDILVAHHRHFVQSLRHVRHLAHAAPVEEVIPSENELLPIDTRPEPPPSIFSLPFELPHSLLMRRIPELWWR